MLDRNTRVMVDPDNYLSIRILDGEAMDRRTLVCQVNGDQNSRIERDRDTAIIVQAINEFLARLK